MKKIIQKLVIFSLSINCFFLSVPVYASNAQPFSFFKSYTEETLASSTNAKKIYRYLVQKMGLNSAAACGILANIRRESLFDPNTLGDSGTSYGICQWHDTAPGIGRYTNLINWCTENGYDYTTLSGQIRFLHYELSQNSPSILYNGKTILDYMLNIENTPDGAYEAGYYWCNTFEVPFSNNPERRAQECDARGILARDIYWTAYGEPTVSALLPIENGIQIQWESFDVAAQYELYRYINNDPSTLTLIEVTDDTGFLDESVKSGNLYTYLLCAVMTRADQTTYTVNAKEISTYYLATPVITTITGSSEAQRVKWKKVRGATSYAIYRSENEGEFSLIDTTSSTTYRDITAITSGSRYDYKIVACHEEEGTEIVYSPSSSRMGTFSLSTPTISSIKSVSDGIKLVWEKVPKAKYYTIYRSLDGSSYREIATVTNRSFVDTDVTNSATVKYKVCAYFLGQYGQISKSLAAESSATFYLKAPKITSLASNASGSITPKWSRNKNATGYEIEYCKNKSFKKSVTSLKIVTNDTTSWTIRNLSKGTAYYVRVRSYLVKDGKKYYSAYSSIKKCTTK